MRSSHTAAATTARFDDPNLVSHAGLVPLMRLAEGVGLADTADELVRLGGSAGANAGAKIATIVAGMATGADSIDDLDQLRHGAVGTLFSGIRAPSTIGTFLRWFALGHVAQLERLGATLLARLAATTPLLPGIEKLAFLDLDSKITQVFGRDKEGARYGYTKVRGLNFLAATLSCPDAAPVITNTRLRGGNVDTRRKITSFAAQALRVSRDCGANGLLVVRGDSGFYVGELIAALTARDVKFSVTARQSKALLAVITTLPEDSWQSITYDNPVFDEITAEPVHTAQITETPYTAFTNPTTNPGQKTTARLIVRRTRIMTTNDQDELFPTWRYHAVFTNSPFDLITAEAQHRDRAGTIEQIFADLNASALAHFPAGDSPRTRRGCR
jgi:Transposase DDE domain group 1